jgi:hypothetical protein
LQAEEHICDFVYGIHHIQPLCWSVMLNYVPVPEAHQSTLKNLLYELCGAVFGLMIRRSIEIINEMEPFIIF